MRSARAIPLLSEDRSHVDIPVQPTTHLAPTCRRAPTRPHGHPPRRRHHQPPQPRQSGRELVTTRRQRTHSTHETSALTSRSRSSDCVAARGIGSGPRCRDSRCSQPRSQMHLAMKSSVRSRSAAVSIGRHTGIVLIVVTARHSASPNVLMRHRITPRACPTRPVRSSRRGSVHRRRTELLTFTNTTSAPVGLQTSVQPTEVLQLPNPCGRGAFRW